MQARYGSARRVRTGSRQSAGAPSPATPGSTAMRMARSRPSQSRTLPNLPSARTYISTKTFRQYIDIPHTIKIHHQWLQYIKTLGTFHQGTIGVENGHFLAQKLLHFDTLTSL